MQEQEIPPVEQIRIAEEKFRNARLDFFGADEMDGGQSLLQMVKAGKLAVQTYAKNTIGGGWHVRGDESGYGKMGVWWEDRYEKAEKALEGDKREINLRALSVVTLSAAGMAMKDAGQVFDQESSQPLFLGRYLQELGIPFQFEGEELASSEYVDGPKDFLRRLFVGLIDAKDWAGRKIREADDKRNHVVENARGIAGFLVKNLGVSAETVSSMKATVASG